jgi:type I restriction enzyme, S subunit
VAAWLNQHIFRVVTQSPETRSFVFFLLKHLKPVFIATAKNKQTTGLGHVTIQDLKRLKIVYPSIEVLKAFADIASPILDRMQCNLEQIALLGSLRDDLFPRLISGKLRVGEISETVEALAS